MAGNERTRSVVSRLASRALRGETLTKKQIKSIAASALTQTPDKKRDRR